MVNHIVTHLARVLMLNAALSAVLIVGSVVFAWYSIITFALNGQYVASVLTFASFLLAGQFLNRAVLPAMKAIKSQRNSAV